MKGPGTLPGSKVDGRDGIVETAARAGRGGDRPRDPGPGPLGHRRGVLGSALDLAAPETMWELTTETPTPHLAAVGADRAFEVGLTGLMSHARTLLPRRPGR